MQKDKELDVNELLREGLEHMSLPTQHEEIEWKFQSKTKDGTEAIYVPYIDARALVERLNGAFGINWSKTTEYMGQLKDGHMFRTTISITYDGTVITSRDGYAPNTDIEPVKGGDSDSFKRAGVMFGFGVDLYDYPTVKVKLKEKTNFPMTFNLVPCFKLIHDAVKAGRATGNDTIIVGDKGAVSLVGEYNKLIDLVTGKKEDKEEKSTVQGAGINKPKKPWLTEPTLEEVTKGLYGGSGVLKNADIVKATTNWKNNGGVLLYNCYIYTVNAEGKIAYFRLDDYQLKKIKE
jgi:hypothetical protein